MSIFRIDCRAHLRQYYRAGPCHRGGIADNSPTFQRWVSAQGGGVSPEEMAEGARAFSAVPSGLTRLSSRYPNVETLGYYRPSLRDEDEILAALERNVRAAPRWCFKMHPGEGGCEDLRIDKHL